MEAGRVMNWNLKPMAASSLLELGVLASSSAFQLNDGEQL